MKGSYPRNITIVSFVFIACILFLALVNLFISIQFRNQFIAYDNDNVTSVGILCGMYIDALESREELFFQLKALTNAFGFEHLIITDTTGHRIFDSRFLRPQFLLSQSRVDFSQEFNTIPQVDALVRRGSTYLYHHGDPEFYLFLTHPSSYLSTYDVIFRWHIFYITFSLIFVGFLGIFLIRNLFMPMRYVTKLARDLGVEMQKEDFVSETFNLMFQKMKTREKTLVEFSTYIAHEFRNAIGAITGLARLVEKGKKSASDITKECRSMEQLIDRLLEYARPLKMVRSEFVIEEFLRDAIERSRPPKHIAIESHIDGSITRMKGDYDLLVMAFANLFKNGYEAMEKKGALIIDVHRENTAMIITVRDTGKGMDPKEIENIFTPFYSGKADGMGLGLAYVNRVIELHNGQITVESTPGKGTLFRIRLPITT